jgi:D-arabinose 1-dehydrogenase-like Zn-dependent alcohol dehydrogenase
MRCYCVLHHGQPLQLVEQPDPVPTGTQVVIKVKAAGLCHTDLHLWEGYYDMGGGKKLQLADRGIKPPMTLSHEIVGEVWKFGPDAQNVPTGKTVVVHPWIGCGECTNCRRGEENICIKPQALGVARPGGFADYVVVPHAKYLVDIGSLNAAEAAPLACAGVTTYAALKKLGQRAIDDPVVIIGAGGLGLMAIQVLKAMGGKGAIVVDIDPVKREAAAKAGAIATVDAKAADAAQQLIAATGGGARGVLDLVGATPTVTLALASVGRGGHIVVCGLMGGDLTLSLPTIPMRPITLQGSYVGTVEELRELVALVKAGKLASIPVTSRPMNQANDAINDLHHGRVVGRQVLVP